MKEYVLAVVQARLSSSRLPRKIIMQVDGRPLIDVLVERLRECRRLNGIVIAIADEHDAHLIADGIRNKDGVKFSYGSVGDVLGRYYKASKSLNPTHVVRITSDCPLIDPVIIDEVINYTVRNDYDYVSNALEPTFPDGMDTEVMKFSALQRAWMEAHDPKDREHVTPYIWRSFFEPGRGFNVGSFKGLENNSDLRITLDYMNDYKLIEALIRCLGAKATCAEYVRYLRNNEAIKDLNASHKRNEGF